MTGSKSSSVMTAPEADGGDCKERDANDERVDRP